MNAFIYASNMGALQCGPGGPWPTQNFGWVGHNAFGPTNNWPVCSLVKLVQRQIFIAITASCSMSLTYKLLAVAQDFACLIALEAMWMFFSQVGRILKE